MTGTKKGVAKQTMDIEKHALFRPYSSSSICNFLQISSRILQPFTASLQAKFNKKSKGILLIHLATDLLGQYSLTMLKLAVHIIYDVIIHGLYFQYVQLYQQYS